MLAYKPSLSLEEIALYFELISGGDDRISVIQFLSLSNILNFRFVHKGDEEPDATVVAIDSGSDDTGDKDAKPTGTSKKEKDKKKGLDLSFAAWMQSLSVMAASLGKLIFCMEFINLLDLWLLMSDHHDANVGRIVIEGLGLEHTFIGATLIKVFRLVTPCQVISFIYILEWVLVSAAHALQVNFGQHVVEKVPLFKVLTKADKRSMISHMHVVDFPAGSYICKQGALGNMFYIITEGTCKVTLTLPGNQEKFLVEFHAGQSFGEVALLDAVGRRTANVVSTSPVCCMALNRDDFNATFKHLRTQLVEYQRLQTANAAAEKKEKEQKEKEKAARQEKESLSAPPTPGSPPKPPAPAEPEKKKEEPKSVKLGLIPDRFQAVFREHCRVVHKLKYPKIQAVVLVATFVVVGLDLMQLLDIDEWVTLSGGGSGSCVPLISIPGLVWLDTYARAALTYVVKHLASLLLGCRFLRCCKMMVLNKDLQTLWLECIGVAPAFFEVMMFAFTFTYMFSMVGFLLFGAQSEEWSTPIQSFVTGLSLCLPQDFVETMEKTMLDTHWSSSFFFYIYFVLGMVITNLSLSIIMEWYAAHQSKDSEDRAMQEENAMQQLFVAVQNHAITRMRLSQSFGQGYRQLPPLSKRYISTNFANMGVERIDVDKKLYGDAEKITLPDLKQCQKQSTINLEEHFNRYQKQHKNLETEANFMAELHRHPKTQLVELVDGEELFHCGGDARKGYFIVDGCVELITADGIGAVIKCSNFVGVEVLEKIRTYNMTCKGRVGSKHDSIHLKSSSKDNVVARLLAITHDMIQLDFDEVTCGMVLKMSFKTQDSVDGILAKHRAQAVKAIRRATLSGNVTPSTPGGLSSVGVSRPHKFFFAPVEEELSILQTPENPVELKKCLTGSSDAGSDIDSNTWTWSPEPAHLSERTSECTLASVPNSVPGSEGVSRTTRSCATQPPGIFERKFSFPHVATGTDTTDTDS